MIVKVCFWYDTKVLLNSSDNSNASKSNVSGDQLLSLSAINISSSTRQLAQSSRCNTALANSTPHRVRKLQTICLYEPSSTIAWTSIQACLNRRQRLGKMQREIVQLDLQDRTQATRRLMGGHQAHRNSTRLKVRTRPERQLIVR
jgi:hypothetical protein